VPEYEKEFLWDHTYKLRERTEQKRRRATSPPAKSVPIFECVPPKYSQPTYEVRDAAPAPPIDLGYKRRSYDSVHAGFEPEFSSRGRRNSGNFNESHRQASTESIRSAPNTGDIARRRQYSRTLSNEGPLDRTQRKGSYEAMRSPRENRTEHIWASEGETTPRKSSGIFSALKKSFSKPPPLPRALSFQYDGRTKSSSRDNKLKTQFVYASDDSDDTDYAGPRYQTPRRRPPLPRQREPDRDWEGYRERHREREKNRFGVENGRTVPVNRQRSVLQDDYVARRDRSESPRGNRRSAERPHILRSSGSGGQASYSRVASSYYSVAEPEPITKEARPKMPSRDPSSSGRRGTYFGEVNFPLSSGPNGARHSRDPVRRNSDPSAHRGSVVC